jgi:hypothetical protein
MDKKINNYHWKHKEHSKNSIIYLPNLLVYGNE